MECHWNKANIVLHPYVKWGNKDTHLAPSKKTTYGGSEVPDNSISFAVVARNRVFVGTLKGLA